MEFRIRKSNGKYKWWVSFECDDITLDDIQQWCYDEFGKDSAGEIWEYCPSVVANGRWFYFAHENDLMLFRLAWS